MKKAKDELTNCANCLHCKQSAESRGINVFAFCAQKKERKEEPLDYWNDKQVCKKFDDMR
ncbi:hypothetical protein FACS189479_05550 [Spirochaetia bacterium]|nr:hypothetical protein FACS189479_05550 [Spirochaetia bacterium]